MVLDSSALLSILFEEPDSSAFIALILLDDTRLLSAATLVETYVVTIRSATPDAVAKLEVLIASLGLAIEPVDHMQAVIARDAFRRYGKGRDKAGLNFGDCFSYALAKSTGERLLFKGNDFERTDIVSV